VYLFPILWLDRSADRFGTYCTHGLLLYDFSLRLLRCWVDCDARGGYSNSVCYLNRVRVAAVLPSPTAAAGYPVLRRRKVASCRYFQVTCTLQLSEGTATLSTPFIEGCTLNFDDDTIPSSDPSNQVEFH
jgi:hypothetical protein